MEQREIKALLEKYWQAQTSLEEEQLLAEYFRQAAVAPELEPTRGLFEWRDEEAEIRPGPDFDQRMLRRIGEMEGGGVDSRKTRGGVVRDFSIRFAAAAAIILCLGIGLLIPAMSPESGRTKVIAANTVITDTYTDPQQALAAVKRALLVASVRMNEGKHITQKNITRLHDTWQTAIGN
jgi:hypothetical protein